MIVGSIDRFRAHAEIGSETEWNRYTFAHVKYLRWELEQHPFPGDEWSAERLLPLLEAAVAGDLAAQRGLFRTLEPLARGRGQGDVIDGWGDDVDWLRDG